MKTKELWNHTIDKPTEPNLNLTNQVFACAFLKDGDVVVAAVGNAILLFDTQKSEMLRPPLRGQHKDTITCLAASKDGNKMVTGSADKTVVVWGFNITRGEKMLDAEKWFSHSDAIQCVAISPLMYQIFTGSNQEYSLWIPGMGNIERQKYKEKIICAAWSADGQYISFGTMSGIVVITDRQAHQLKEISTQKGGPVWCMEWTPITSEYQQSQLTVGVWMNSLYQFDCNGQQIGARIELPFDPLHINYQYNGEYMAIAGNNNKINLYTREGGFLIEACSLNDWIWCTKLKPKSTVIVCGTNDGDIVVQELLSENVTALYDDKFVQREQLTDAIILSMISNQKARIKCKELVKRVAIFKEKVAILCGIKVLIYTCVIKGDDFMKYKQFKKFQKRVDCEHFQLASSNVLIGAGQKLIAFNFNGDMDKTWSFESPITVVSCQGGAPKRELVLIGLENGGIYKIFLDNSFPIQIHKVNTHIKYLTMSQTKRKMALIDGNQNLQVLDTISKEVLFGEMGVEGVAFNQEFEDLIAYSGKGLLFFKCITFPALNQKISGNVIGFKGCKLFLQNNNQVQTIDIQQTANMQRYLEKKDFLNALKIACLGVTEQDIRALGIEALIAGEFEIARRCFLRNKDYQFIDLLLKYEKKNMDAQTLNELNAEALAYQGRFMDAGNLLIKVGQADRAVQLFKELRRWDDAINFAKKGDVAYRAVTSGGRTGTGVRAPTSQGRTGTGRGQAVMPQPQDIAPPKIEMNMLLREQAEWTKESGDWKAAAELFVTCQEYKKAIELYGQNKYLDGLINVCRMLDRQENSDNIVLCANYFKKLKHHGGAKEAYLKLNDLKNLMILHVEFQKWQEALQIGRSNKELLEIAKVPYADYLLLNDRYEDALKAYKSAGRFDITMKMTKDMAKNCIEEQRYHDASQYLWNLAIDCLNQIQDYKNPSGDDVKAITQYHEYSDLADVYYAYQKIHSFICEPFQPLSGESYFQQIMNSSRFIISKWKSVYQGIKMSYVYYALAKCAAQLACFKTTRICYEKLNQFKIHAEWSEEIDLQSLLVRSKPYTDDESKLPLCMRCSTYNVIINVNEQLSLCNACLHPLFCSFISFSTLPLVEFKVDNSLSRDDVERLLNSEKVFINKRPGQLFQDKINEIIQQQQTSQDQYLVVELDETAIQSLSPEEVLIVDYRQYCSTIDVKYYKNMVGEQPIHVCPDCGRFFYIDEHEFEYIQKKCCPFCRISDKKIPQKDIFDI
ncbi:unnamed protein product [Paramecium pentaurelia]|uniref:Intraflagellar transport protein 122 homolog n=1 Tax=Paramecium pentaurelia TaxID=43138 RepID=A0A8S1Y6B2_9CILI|nr:unnamed protein product [Paramecium pentaurelia]